MNETDQLMQEHKRLLDDTTLGAFDIYDSLEIFRRRLKDEGGSDNDFIR